MCILDKLDGIDVFETMLGTEILYEGVSFIVMSPTSFTIQKTKMTPTVIKRLRQVAKYYGIELVITYSPMGHLVEHDGMKFSLNEEVILHT